MANECENRREENQRAIAEQNSFLKKKYWKGECHKVTKEEREEVVRKKMEGKTKL